jgi:hypothetical protein
MKPIYAKKIVKELEIPASLSEKRGGAGWDGEYRSIWRRKLCFVRRRLFPNFAKETFDLLVSDLSRRSEV